MHCALLPHSHYNCAVPASVEFVRYIVDVKTTIWKFVYILSYNIILDPIGQSPFLLQLMYIYS